MQRLVPEDLCPFVEGWGQTEQVPEDKLKVLRSGDRGLPRTTKDTCFFPVLSARLKHWSLSQSQTWSAGSRLTEDLEVKCSVSTWVHSTIRSCWHLAGKFFTLVFGYFQTPSWQTSYPVSGLFQVVGYGKYELEEDSTPFGEDSNSREGMQLTYLLPSPLLADSTIPITDIRAFTSTLSLFPYHKIVK